MPSEQIPVAAPAEDIVVRDLEGRLDARVPDDWIVEQKRNFTGFFFDKQRADSALPHNLSMRTFDAPASLQAMEPDEALIEAAFVAGLRSRDLRETRLVESSLFVDAKTFGRFYFVIFNRETSRIVVFNTGIEGLFASDDFLAIVDSISFTGN